MDSVLIPISALLLGVGVLEKVINVFEYIGMGCIFLGLMVIDGRALKWIKSWLNFKQEFANR
jgi:drug/metabolite transporter (DMT)-like permease